MALKYLMDENVTPIYATQLRRKRPDLVVWAVGEIGTPPKSTLDPEILVWRYYDRHREEIDRIIVSHHTDD